MQRLNENIMQNVEQNTPLANNHISVDCVVIGFDGEQLKVLLVKRAGEEEGEVFHDMKLPGSLIYMDEDLDEAAQRVLNELTGLKNVNLMQFKAFGSKNRTKDPRDVHWLERAMQSKVERIVTIAYLSLVKIDHAQPRSGRVYGKLGCLAGYQGTGFRPQPYHKRGDNLHPPVYRVQPVLSFRPASA